MCVYQILIINNLLRYPEMYQMFANENCAYTFRRKGTLPLYHGPVSELFKREKEFVFSERAFGFIWPEHVKAGVVGQHLAGIAQNYYHRQVEA